MQVRRYGGLSEGENIVETREEARFLSTSYEHELVVWALVDDTRPIAYRKIVVVSAEMPAQGLSSATYVDTAHHIAIEARLRTQRWHALHVFDLGPCAAPGDPVVGEGDP